MTAPAVAPEVSRRPIVGALAGLSFGLGLSLLLISFSVIALGTMTPLVVIVLGVVGGIALALLAPAPRAARGAAPVAEYTPPPAAAYEAPPAAPAPPPAAPAAADAYQPPPTPAPPAAPPPAAEPTAATSDEPPPPPPPGPAGPPLRP